MKDSRVLFIIAIVHSVLAGYSVQRSYLSAALYWSLLTLYWLGRTLLADYKELTEMRPETEKAFTDHLNQISRDNRNSH